MVWSLGACTSSDEVTSSAGLKAPVAAGADSGSLAGPAEPFVIEAEPITAAPGAPEWCRAMLTEPVRSLPSAMFAVGEADHAEEVAAVMAGAAAGLRAPEVAASPAGPAAADLAAALDDFGIGTPTAGDLDRLVAALEELEGEVTVCGFSG